MKGNEIIVSKQDLVAFSVGDYKDKVICDLLHINACHLLIGMPWQYDRKFLHHGKYNTYSFKLYGRRWTLSPLAPAQLHKPEGRKGNPKEEWKKLSVKKRLFLLS